MHLHFRKPTLRKIRILIAAHVFGFFLLGFLSAANEGLPKAIHGFAHFQFVPALLFAATGIALPLAVLLIATLLYGRIYCSCLCPTGILQDCIARIDRLLRKKKKRYRALPPHNAVRYSIMEITAAAWILGFNAILTLIDPYGIFGRIGANIVRPIGVLCNNLAALVCNAFGEYYFVNTELPDAAAGALIAAGIMLAGIALMSYRHGRLYCNLICPVGTLLGVISKIALVKVKISEDKCSKCMLCANKCKSGCIDVKRATIDYSRCIACGSCLDVCKKDAIKLKYTFLKNVKKKQDGKI